MSKIVFWQAGDNDGCSFYRCQEPARVLATMGHDTYSGRIMMPSLYEDADTIVAQRLSETGPSLVWAGLAEKGDHELVYELDDDLLAVPEHFGSVYEAYANPARRARILMAMDRADFITTTNEHLAQAVRDHLGQPNKDVRIIPNYVPERLVASRLPAMWEHGRPIVGWAGSGSHRQDFEQLVIPLRKLLRERRANVRIIGPNYTPRLRTAVVQGTCEEKLDLSHVEWVDGVDNFVQALDFQIGLAPLVDSPFNRSKSDIKLKEYAARGLVSLASCVGPYATSDAPAWGHRAAADWEEWLDELLRCEFPLNFGYAALTWARENTIEKHAIEWEKALVS